MKSSIRGVNIEITPAIREYIEKKLSKLDRYFDNTDLLEAKVNVKVNSGTQKVEVTIPMKQMVLRAEERNTDVYAAMDLVSWNVRYVSIKQKSIAKCGKLLIHGNLL
mgnify:CR=1 FL=1